MNRERLRLALNTISMGFAEAAEALNDAGQGNADSRSSVASPASSYEAQPSLGDVSVSFAEGSIESCPRHHKAYRDGKVTKPNPSGKFCASKADDAWSYNGWCSINPSNVAEYLRQAAQ